VKQLFLVKGEISIEDVPLPTPGPSQLLVQTVFSAISSGTEATSVKNSKQSLVLRAVREPNNVRRAFDYARSKGVSALVERVRGDASLGATSGYSLSGRVIAVGINVEGFRVGDNVAVAGAGVANHAEFVVAPVNLCVPLPEGVSFEAGCTATIGAIALQAVRRLNPTIGETVVVLGLGLVGQLVNQILVANGCRVIGVDTNDSRVSESVDAGAVSGLNPLKVDAVREVLRLTHEFGADGVVVAAASRSSALVADAMKMSRRKGRVVVVGDVGLNIRRDLMYEKELDLLVSTSYGPGRYDPDYEEAGLDYPLPYVRWTLARNMGAYLDLVARKAVRLEKVSVQHFPFAMAKEAFQVLAARDRPVILALLRYEDSKAPQAPPVEPSRSPVAPPKKSLVGTAPLRVAVVGASSFAVGTHLPLLKAMKDKYELVTVCSRTTSSAESVRRRFGFRDATTDVDSIAADDSIDLVLVATRHDLHGDLARVFLDSGKHVFLEKPLTIYPDDLSYFENRARSSSDSILLSVGYNRRFAPTTLSLRSRLSSRTGPAVIDYRVNAGLLPLGHWLYGPEGGGRNIGEACHFYDFFIALTGCLPARGPTVVSSRARSHPTDIFSTAMEMTDGSVCSLTYFDNGSSRMFKERIEVSWDSETWVLDDFRSLSQGGRFQPRYRSQDKGFKNQWSAMHESVVAKKPLIPFAEIAASSRVSFQVESELRGFSLLDEHPDS